MEFTSCKEEGTKGEGVEDVAHNHKRSERNIIRDVRMVFLVRSAPWFSLTVFSPGSEGSVQAKALR